MLSMKEGAMAQYPELRTPVIENGEKLYDREKVMKQWELLSTLAMREIKVDPDLRAQVVELAALPLSEKLGKAFFDILRTNENASVQRLAERYADGDLYKMLSLDEVPDELIVPDIINAPGYHPHRPGDEISPEGSDGLTNPERDLISDRYIVGRNVKRLILGAEILDNPDIEVDESGRLELPSGISITVDPEKADQVTDLMNPDGWTTNRQWKDRVYEVSTDAGQYIMKERKTNKHRHLKERGHRDGITSQQEFATARFFESIGTTNSGDVDMRFEHPVGFVEYPDGYSFTMFEKEEHMWPIGDFGRGERAVQGMYAYEMIDNPEHYECEFQIYKGLAEVIEESPEIFDIEIKSGRIKTPLDFESFAKVKAEFDIDMAGLMYDRTLAKHGFNNTDHDGYAFKIYKSSEQRRARLEMIGFDFEYYKFDQVPGQREEEDDMIVVGYIKDKLSRLTSNSRMKWSDNTERTVMEEILYMAMLSKAFPEHFDGGVQLRKDHDLTDSFNFSNRVR